VAALNLDHGGSYEEIVAAIRAGFTSVMIDRSKLPYKQNVEEVKEIVKIAHHVGVSVEAELGHVGMGYEYESTRDSGLTKPEEAISYIEETGVDCLAVAVGTSHGTYSGEPHLEFELLEKLNSMIDIPLVLHGGSGTGDENLKKAVKIGIQKVNLFTDLSNAGLGVLKDYLMIDRTKMEHDRELGEFGNKNANLIETFLKGTEGYKQALKHYMTLFESNGKC
jgi:fructose-bisphosphate aldolase class II